MGARFTRELARSRATDQGCEIALDLTPAEVVLYEGGAAQGWRRFAGVALEDPEFLAVIGLLRAEAESTLGAGRPVRLWLPDEQVLAVSASIGERDPSARLRAAFRHACRETGHAAQDIAVAVAPPGESEAITLLVTYAATWHEARDYAARWGFVPGPVSTRHRAEQFGPAGPVFLLEATAHEKERAGRRRPAWPALALAAMIWPMLAPAAAAGQAPAAAPLPEARWHERPAAAQADSAGAMPGLVAMLPPARPEASGGPAPVVPLPGTPQPIAPPRGAGGSRGNASVRPEPAAEPLGLAAPLPSPRPARLPGAGAAAAGTAVAAATPDLFSATQPAAAGATARGLPRDQAALVGILNLDTGRKALLRLPDGAYRSVQVGDVLDGWRVSAIGVDALRVSRGGESRTLLLVSR